ncbi:MAG: CopD family protein [Pseudomonadota bacterium]
MILWYKAFHIIFMVCWFAGIFYLPRLFVYYASSDNEDTRGTLRLMSKKLFYFVTPFALLTLVFGTLLLSASPSAYMSAPWFKLKLFLVVVLIAYHISCFFHLRRIQQNTNTRSHVYFRFYNEAPVLLLFSIVILVILKPHF